MEAVCLSLTLLLILITNLCSIIGTEGKSVTSVAWVRKTGQFSWLYPKVEIDEQSGTPIKHEFIKASKKKTINDLNKKERFKIHEETILERFNHAAIEYSLQKTFAGLRLWKGENYRVFLTNDYSLIISYKLWPFGWRHYPFKIEIAENPNNKGFILLLSSVNSHRSLHDYLLQIDLIPSTESSGTLLLGNVHSHPKVSKRMIKSFFTPIINHIKKSLTEYAKMYERRQIQHQEYNRTSQSAEEKRRKLERDRIIHPEKYKSKSPTVKGVGSSSTGGGGRYTPSADARARREVRRGG